MKSEVKNQKSEVSLVTSIFIMLTTVFTVLATGAIAAVFSTSFEGSCTPDATGKVVCTQNFKFKGWEGIPLQGLAGAVGTGIGIYAAIKSGKLPGIKPEAESLGGGRSDPKPFQEPPEVEAKSDIPS